MVADVYDDGALTDEILADIERFGLFVPTADGMGRLVSAAGFVDVRVHTREGTRWMCAEGRKALARDWCGPGGLARASVHGCARQTPLH